MLKHTLRLALSAEAPILQANDIMTIDFISSLRVQARAQERISMPPKTMFEKIWDAHVVHEEAGEPAIIYIDLHLVHEVTSPQASSSGAVITQHRRRSLRPWLRSTCSS